MIAGHFPCRSSQLCDSFDRLAALKCTAQQFIYHKFHEELGPLWAQPSWHTEPCSSTQAQSTWMHFYHHPASLWLSFPLWQTRLNTHQQINGYMHAHMQAHTHSQSLKADVLMIQTHTRSRVPPWWLWPGKESLHTSIEGIWMEQLLVCWQQRLSHNSLAWQASRKVLTASWLWSVWPGVMGTYLWLLCVLCGHVVKTEHT